MIVYMDVLQDPSILAFMYKSGIIFVYFIFYKNKNYHTYFINYLEEDKNLRTRACGVLVFADDVHFRASLIVG